MTYEYWNHANSWINNEPYYFSSSTSNYVRYYHGQTCYWPRRILVTSPKAWTDDDVMAFVDLVNNCIRTDCVITMVIKGHVLITDPSIETRTMEEFIPLLRSMASPIDKGKIARFFEEHPIMNPADKPDNELPF